MYTFWDGMARDGWGGLGLGGWQCAQPNIVKDQQIPLHEEDWFITDRFLFFPYAAPSNDAEKYPYNY